MKLDLSIVHVKYSRMETSRRSTYRLVLKEALDDFRGIWNQMLEILENREDRHHSVAANLGMTEWKHWYCTHTALSIKSEKRYTSTYVAVTVVETLLDGGNEWLNDLGLLELAEEAQSGATNKLVRVLEILAESDMR